MNKKKCCICNILFSKAKRCKQRKINQEAIIEAFIKTGVLIKTDSRCCSDHLYKGRFREEALSNLKASYDTIKMSNYETVNLIFSLKV